MLHFERARPSTALFWASKLLNFDFNADPDPDFHSNSDPDPAPRNNADPQPWTLPVQKESKSRKEQVVTDISVSRDGCLAKAEEETSFTLAHAQLHNETRPPQHPSLLQRPSLKAKDHRCPVLFDIVLVFISVRILHLRQLPKLY